jgi:branched-chain amino acid transport system permease protein
VTTTDKVATTPSSVAPAGPPSTSAPTHYGTLSRIDWKLVGVGAGFYVIAFLLPTMPAGGFTDYWTGLLASAPVYAIAILSLVVLARATASISLCQAAFMGVSAYAFSYLSISSASGGLGWSLLPAFVVAVLVVAPVGMTLALPALRMRGLELALLTLTVGTALSGLIFNGNAPLSFSETAGAFLETPAEPFGLDLADPVVKYRFFLTVAAVVFALVGLVLISPIGATWQAMRAGNAVASASGIRIFYYQLIGFGLSALLAGLAGVLLVMMNTFADPGGFSAGASTMFVVIAMVVGIDLMRAGVIGGLITGLGTAAFEVFNIQADYLTILTGFGLVVIIVVRGRRSQVLEQ